MSRHEEVKSNRLIHEKSTYLLQHARNPVDWYPWGNEAFEKAKRENKPIFLSIGYSTCHWCHVMEKECFQDAEVARLLNEAFVCVKVDREERPDIDTVYMAICQILTGSGGWPLTIIMTPDRKPFFAATYVPKTTRFNMTGMLDLIPRIREAWKSKKQETEKISEQVLMQLESMQTDAGHTRLEKEKIHEAYQLLTLSFDEQHGGFGTAPKFPTAHNLLFLLRYWKRTKQEHAIRIVEQTLKAMRSGGIYDQVSFGFHRYSVDAQWLVPHFEKMLYDQAMLAMAYIECYQATGNQEYEKTAKEILEYVTREMTSKEGGFYSAEDADSEGKEGKFYLWTEDEIRKAINADQANLAITVFGVTKRGNFRDAEQTGDGRNILRLVKPPKEIAAKKGISQEEIHDQISNVLSILRTYRDRRVHPAKDDKILTDWNGLMIAAFAKAAQVFDEEKYLQAARNSADFLLGKMKTANDRLLHRYRLGEASVDGFLEDYAFLIWGLIELFEACFETRYLQYAVDLTNIMLKDFSDKNRGGFYSTSEKSDQILVRMKQTYDGAIPSGNSVAVLNLLRLARLTAESTYEEYAAKTIQAFSKTLSDMPEAHIFMMIALDFAYGPSYEVVVTGATNTEDTRSMLKTLKRQYTPHSVLLYRPIEQKTSEATYYLNRLADYKPINGRATAYVCQNRICKQPTNKLDKLLDMLNT